MSLLAISVNSNTPEVDKPWRFKTGFVPVICSLRTMGEHITTSAWSPCLWKDGTRNVENFIKAYGIAVDVDDGVSMQEAHILLKDVSHIIAPTKSNMQPKRGIVMERFRIFLPTQTVITDSSSYSQTCKKYITLLRGDKCHDAGRFFWPSSSIKFIADIPNRILTELPLPASSTRIFLPPTGTMLEIIAHNIISNWQKHGGRNNAAYIAAKRLKEAGRSDNYAVGFLSQRTDLPKRELENSVRSAWRT
jgi:hypothetical protein